jgi:N-acetylglucosaminyldiphosphoundecaprenol N-acetyl-beta-D-mannosaminyltransferase
VTGQGGHDMGSGAISVRRTDEDASWEPQAFLPASRHILGMRVDATSYRDATERIIGWARRSESRYVCVAAVNNVMQAYEDEGFREAMNRADLVTPDGMPLVWGLRWLGVRRATRVYGPELTPALLGAAAERGIPVGFYGGAPHVLDTFVLEAHRRWPDLKVVYAYSPPYRELTTQEDAAVARAIDASGARIVLVGLGCPKQEQWMASHEGRFGAVLVGVGAAFDFLTGAKRQAPRVLQNAGLEWLFRLATEPKRLLKRYLGQNPRFALLFSAQLVRAHLVRSPSFSRKETH